MIELAKLAEATIVLILALLALAVFYDAVTGRIRMAGLLRSKTTGDMDPGRVQLLVTMLLLGATLLTQLTPMRQAGRISLPDRSLLYVLGGSEAVYLARKYLQVRSSRKGD